MEMTVDEIKRSYDQAKHKDRQISILAELNDCSREEIEKVVCVENKRRTPAEKPKELCLSEIIEKLYADLEEIDGQIKILEEAYKQITVAIKVLEKVGE